MLDILLRNPRENRTRALNLNRGVQVRDLSFADFVTWDRFSKVDEPPLRYRVFLLPSLIPSFYFQIIAHNSRYARTYNFYLQLLFNKQSFKQSYLIITLHNLGSLCTLFSMVENLHNFFRNLSSDFIIMFMKLHNFLNSFLSLILKTILLLFRNITKVE